jgi:hypothetical protein
MERIFSPVRFVSENPQNCGDLLLFPGQSRQISPHFRLYGGEGGILLTPHKHSAVLLFFNEFQTGNLFLPSELAHSTAAILPEMVAKW